MSASLKKKVIVLTVFFTSGAFSALLGNVLYHQKSTGLHDVVKEFRKPWFQGWSMFLGMSLLIFDTPWAKNFKCPEFKMGDSPAGWGLFRLVSIPAMCDMIATVLQNVALLYLPPSVWQMTRGSILLFTALFSIFYRKKKLYAVDWLGVVTTILGITIVGISAIMNGDNTNIDVPMMIISMVLIIIAQGLQAFQTIVEEELLHDANATDSEVVSYEGLWGLFLTTFIAMPVAQIMPENSGEAIYENSLETFAMIFRSPTIIILVLVYLAAITGYNLSGMMITTFSTAIHRNIYEALRSAAVWVLSVIIYYLFPSSGAGEPVSWASLLQLFGFSVSILGSFIYNRVVKLPCCNDGNQELN